jgi:hypothetical protein
LHKNPNRLSPNAKMVNEMLNVNGTMFLQAESMAKLLSRINPPQGDSIV